jgi:AraC family transcriptional regulator, regulatory protein of adaptative response / methylated-DNA-[protein]-cysteine methyltransferase
MKKRTDAGGTAPAALPTAASQQDPRWAALIARDPQADGTFFYAVRTTGVYCRPSCPSRRALPRNVSFHATAAEAERAGFRACKRCRPGGPTPADRHARIVARICRYIENAPRIPTLRELARRANLSPYHFHRIFSAVAGLSPRAYALAQRTRRVRAALQRGQPVTAAIYDAGFGSGGRFYEKAGALLGMTPRTFRAGGAATDIHFALGRCRLGHVLVARSARGICAILLGDEPERLLQDLQARFPRANLIGGDAGFDRWVAQVVGFVDAPAVGLGLPLDVRGTAFQQRVWQALSRIPPGSTASYAEIAHRIGAPGSARAVARACAANALAVAIPCHRVVRQDGALSGYRWGVERKRALLLAERQS